MDLEHAAGVVGAAIGQRKFAADSGLAPLQKLVLPFRAETGSHPSDVAQNVAKLAEELRHRARAKHPPVEVPSATLGKRLIRNGASGSGENWRAGMGAAALSQMTHSEMDAGAPGFGARESLVLRRVLASLAHRTV